MTLLIVTAQPAFAAACTLNGEVIPCDQMPKWVWAFLIVMAVLSMFFFVFWLRMLLDAIKNQTENKTMWVLLIIFLNVLGAIIYYFAEKRKRGKNTV